MSAAHKSAVTYHVVEKNHVRWMNVKVIGTDRETIEIRKRGHNTMNRDEGQYFLTHIFDELLEKSPGKKLSGNSKPTRYNNID